MKKIFIPIISLVFVTVLGITIYFSLPDQNSINLTISSDNISLSVGEVKKLEFEVSIDSAIIDFEIKNKNILNIFSQDGDSFIKGLSMGYTDIILTGRYKDLRYEKVINVNVSEKTEIPDDSDEEKIPTVDDPIKEDKMLIFNNFINCEVEENSIFLKDNFAILSVSYTYNIESLQIISLSDKLLVDNMVEIGNNTYSFTALDNGCFEVEFIVNGEKFIYEIIY